MRIESDEQRRAVQGTIKEVMVKLEEALRLAREAEAAHEETCTGAHA